MTNSPTERRSRPADDDTPSALVFSQRARRPQVSRCHAYEMERVIVEITGGEMWSPGPTRSSRLVDRVAVRLGTRFEPALHLPRPVAPPESGSRHDLLVVAVQRPMDLATVSLLGDWRRYSDRAVVYIEEVWTSEVTELRRLLDLVRDFDARFVTSANTIPELERVTERPWTFLPFGVDAAEFAPAQPGLPRPIDVINIGRRSPETHAGLIEWAEQGSNFYYFDSFSPLKVKDPDEHRWLLAELLRRSKIAISNRGIGFDPQRTRQQEELAFRYFEAAAAGAVMVGQPPDTPHFSSLFDWPDSLIEAPFDLPAPGELLDELCADPVRMAAIERRNVAESLVRHDHVHRWIAICEHLGMAPGAAAGERVDQLARRAATWRGEPDALTNPA